MRWMLISIVAAAALSAGAGAWRAWRFMHVREYS